MIMFHHRWPTSTINVRQAAHPFTTKKFFGDTEYILIHNGHINNAEELFVAHQELGIDYQSLLPDLTFNDSEALLWDFALVMEGKQEGLKARGAVALICMKLAKGEREVLYFGRNSSPLYLNQTDDYMQLASEGTGISVKQNTLYTYDYAGKTLMENYMDFHTLSYGGYSGAYERHGGYSPREWYGGYVEEEEDLTPYGERQIIGFQPPKTIGRKQRRRLEKKRAKQVKMYQRSLLEAGGKKTTESYRQNPHTGIYEPIPKSTESELVQSVGAVLANRSYDVPLSSSRIEHMVDDALSENGSKAEDEYDNKVRSLLMLYMLGADFSFSRAYWAMDGDYKTLEEQADNDEKREQLDLLQDAVCLLDEDPEYIDETSVSSEKGRLWQQIATV